MKSRERSIALFLFFILVITDATSAHSGTDSLRRLLYAHPDKDTTRVTLLLHLADKYEMASSDTVRNFGVEALSISQQLHYNKGIVNAYEMLGAAHNLNGNYDSALYYFRKSILLAQQYHLGTLLASKYNHIGNLYLLTGKYAESNTYYDSAIHAARSNGNIEIEAKASSNLANVFYKMGNYTRALNYYLSGLKIEERLGLNENIASDLSSIANVYYRLGMYGKAVAYTDRAMILHKQIGAKEPMIGSLTTYALIYNDRKMYDSSLYYLNEALQLAKEIQSPYLENLLIGNIAEASLNKGDYAKAYELYDKSLSMSAKLDDAEGLAIAKAGIGYVYLKQGNTTKGQQYLAEALDMMQKLGIKEQALDIASKLSASYEQSGNYKKAVYFLRVQNGLSDSLRKEKAQEEVKQLIFNYEIQKKEDKIKLLEKDNTMIESRNEYQKIMLWTLFAGFIITAGIAYLLYRNMQQVRTSRKLIMMQKAEIEKQAEKLSDLNDFKDNTFSLLAHDLRSPVNALGSTLMLLDEKVITPEEFLTYKQELNNKLQSVSILLDNMLYWAKSQMKGEHTLEIKKINIKRTVLKTMSVLGDVAQHKNITIRSEVAPTIWAMCDKDHIDIVVRNLVSNAIKFTQDGGEIVISASESGNTTSIVIADNGVGMTNVQLGKLFSDNSRASTKGTEGEMGTGLGLSLCYDLIKKNNGDIKVSSTAGKGSEFTILLPNTKA